MKNEYTKLLLTAFFPNQIYIFYSKFHFDDMKRNMEFKILKWTN